MPATKIQNEREIIRWFEEGRTYQWMVEEYRRKYGIETVPSLWGNFRRRRGLQRRTIRNDELIPWLLKDEHRWLFPIQMLRAEARRRSGKQLREDEKVRVDAWLRRLAKENTVLHYDPDTEEGWFYVLRREGIDTDVIRVPERKTTTRPAAD